MAGRISQQPIEVETIATPNARISQDGVEAEVVGTPSGRLSQLGLEAETTGSGRARESQIIVECLVPNIEVFMPLVYPTLPGLGYSTFWKPDFFNMPTQTTSSGADLDLGISASPLHDFELTYNFLSEGFRPGTSEFRTMLGFFGALSGNLLRFLFKNPDDNYVQSQKIATTDGTTHIWTLIRTFGIGEYVWSEPVGYVDLTRPVRVYLDGVLQDPSTYSIVTTEPVLQQVQFNSTPSAGKVITVDMGYFYYCKMSAKNLSFEKFMNQLWLLKKVTLHSNRAGT